MATTLDTCDDLIAQLDTNGSEGHSLEERKESGWNKRKEYESDNIFNQYICLHSSSPVGGLALELWWDILEIVDDPRALIATGCTCKTLRDVVREIITKRTYRSGTGPTTAIHRSCGVTLRKLGDLLSDPTGGYFFSEAWIKGAELPLWMLRYDTKSPRLRTMTIGNGRLLLPPQMRCAFSRLKSVTTLHLMSIHFSTFSDFARTVCALPNLDTLRLFSVTVEDSRSYSLEGVYFARDLHLKNLEIWDCTFGELHPIWNLLTAPSLSDSLEHIHAQSYARNPERALQQLYIPPAALLSASLGRLKQVLLEPRGLSCSSEAVCDRVLGLLSHSPAGRIAAIEIDYACDHSPPWLTTWVALIATLDNVVMVADFTALRTISVYLETKYPFDVDTLRVVIDSQPHSPQWTEKFTMARMVFANYGDNNILPYSEQISEKTKASVEARPGGIALSIRFGPLNCLPYRATIVYTRRPGS
ncbi:hypothetical protein CERSUDRAFT_67279 [Gelatoporia subvermispora B]|uniref:F-box domain-containing protein n=1 Tax=Ceriporiopsis subvermispora (strain B) TaxID=914234 RepID=M2R5K6_CERS8|nr:hypothetical protein CERSUDRAFT_67279 [Gelatoporia subvermispora B]